MLVASEQAASAFLIVQLRGLEAHVISQLVQEGKERLRGRFALCHPPLSKAPPLFYPQERSDEEAHGSPAESEVLHGNQQRCSGDANNLRIYIVFHLCPHFRYMQMVFDISS
jgi:hypothetical protein